MIAPTTVATVVFSSPRTHSTPTLTMSMLSVQTMPTMSVTAAEIAERPITASASHSRKRISETSSPSAIAMKPKLNSAMIARLISGGGAAGVSATLASTNATVSNTSPPPKPNAAHLTCCRSIPGSNRRYLTTWQISRNSGSTKAISVFAASGVSSIASGTASSGAATSTQRTAGGVNLPSGNAARAITSRTQPNVEKAS